MSSEEQSVGIDLGTTFSVVAHLDRTGKPVTVPNDEGELSTPSVVFFDNGGTVVGNEAINAGEFDPVRVAKYAKRDVGNSKYEKPILGHSFPPEVIQAILLSKLKDDTELKIGNFSEAVITVPAYFNEPRRKATHDAGTLAGIEVMDIINEPTAAAIAYGIKEGFIDAEGEATEAERLLVYDLGGGTFDISLMDIKGSDFQTVATAGDVHLGGIDWDWRLVGYLAGQFKEAHGVDPLEDSNHVARLRGLASRAKKTLTVRETAQVRYAIDSHKSTFEISREKFNELTVDLVERTRMSVARLLKDVGLGWKDLSRLILVGGSTRMPMIQEMLEKESGLKPDRSLSPDEAVAHGAAAYADILKRRKVGKTNFSITNVNSHDLGVLGVNPKTKQQVRQLMIPRNTPLPVVKTKKFATSKDDQRDVVVTVVEGGTDTGQGANRVGNCRVSGLPPGLKKGCTVNVTFQYSSDGRLKVDANLPQVDVRAATVIERASGMTEDEIERWKSIIAGGIDIEKMGDLLTASGESASTGPDAVAVVPPAAPVAGSQTDAVVEQSADPIIDAGGKKSAAADSVDPVKLEVVGVGGDKEAKPVANEPLPDFGGNKKLDQVDSVGPIGEPIDFKLPAEKDAALDDFLNNLDD